MFNFMLIQFSPESSKVEKKFLKFSLKAVNIGKWLIFLGLI
jgi:hypothetical protein